MFYKLKQKCLTKDQNTFELRTFLLAFSLQCSLSQYNNISFSASVRVSRCDIESRSSFQDHAWENLCVCLCFVISYLPYMGSCHVLACSMKTMKVWSLFSSCFISSYSVSELIFPELHFCGSASENSFEAFGLCALPVLQASFGLCNMVY